MASKVDVEYMGISEIVDFIGVSYGKLSMWKSRGLNNMPEPIASLAMGPVYDKANIVAWKAWLKKEGLI